MKAKELRLMSDAKMDGKLAELRKELMRANSQIAIGTVPKSPGKVREAKKTIAKIMTIRREKTLSREDAKRNE